MQLYVPTAARAGAPKEQCHSFILRVSQKVNAMRPHNLLHLLHPRRALRPHDLLQLGQGLLLERDTFSMQLPTQPLDVVPAVLCVAVQRPQEQQPRANPNRPRVVEKILLTARGTDWRLALGTLFLFLVTNKANTNEELGDVAVNVPLGAADERFRSLC